MAYVGGPRLFVFVPSEQCERIYKPRCTFNRKGGLNFLGVTFTFPRIRFNYVCLHCPQSNGPL